MDIVSSPATTVQLAGPLPALSQHDKEEDQLRQIRSDALSAVPSANSSQPVAISLQQAPPAADPSQVIALPLRIKPCLQTLAPDAGKICSLCGTRQTTAWRKSLHGKVVCNVGLIFFSPCFG